MKLVESFEHKPVLKISGLFLDDLKLIGAKFCPLRSNGEGLLGKDPGPTEEMPCEKGDQQQEPDTDRQHGRRYFSD